MEGAIFEQLLGMLVIQLIMGFSRIPRHFRKPMIDEWFGIQLNCGLDLVCWWS